MNKSKANKSKALGINIGTATARLRKRVLFSLVCRLGENKCYQCGEEICSVEELSMEHKEPWLQANSPVESFFDLNNIAFSHLRCNCAAATKPGKIYESRDDKRRASDQRRWAKKTQEEKKDYRRRNYEKYGN